MRTGKIRWWKDRSGFFALGIFVALLLAIQIAAQQSGTQDRSSIHSEYPIRFALADIQFNSTVRTSVDKDSDLVSTEPDRGLADATAGEPSPGSNTNQENFRVTRASEQRQDSTFSLDKRFNVMTTDFRLQDVGLMERELRKEIFLGDRSLGKFGIAINRGGEISIPTESLDRLIAVSSRNIQSSPQRSLSLGELRELGIDLRYDPVRDRMLLQSK